MHVPTRIHRNGASSVLFWPRNAVVSPGKHAWRPPLGQPPASSWAHDWLTNWTLPTDSISWTVAARQPARYVADLRYTCPPAAVGSAVQLSVNNQSVTGKVTSAFDPPLLPSPDRVPRKEAFEKPWARLKLGAVTIPKGETRLVLRAVTIAGRQVVDVKAIELEPAASLR